GHLAFTRYTLKAAQNLLPAKLLRPARRSRIINPTDAFLGLADRRSASRSPTGALAGTEAFGQSIGNLLTGRAEPFRCGRDTYTSRSCQSGPAQQRVPPTMAAGATAAPSPSCGAPETMPAAILGAKIARPPTVIDARKTVSAS